MFKNYLLTLLRNWRNNKLFTFINIGGLTVGLTCAVFIMLFVRDELSYDRWIPDSENLYRVETTVAPQGQTPLPFTKIAFRAPAAMIDQIPEITTMTRLALQDATVSIENREFLEHIDVVDPQFFQVVKLPLLEGDPVSVLSHPESVVISQSVARKYFGSEAGIVGKSLNISGAMCSQPDLPCQTVTRTLIVTGILRDLPHNTQIAADIVIPNTSAVDLMMRRWKEDWSPTTFAYVKLAQGADPGKVLAKLKSIIDESLKGAMGSDPRRPSELMVPHLTRFWDVHLTTDRYGGLTAAGNRTTVYGFAVIGVLILLVACFNFTNLAIAASTLRAREISLRKVMGARRDQIIVQFIGEAILMALVAFVLMLAFIQPLLPPFDRLLNKPITMHYLSEWPILLIIAVISVIAGFLSGLYPALVLSNFKPAVTLRSSMAQVTGSGRFRTTLVILQFAVSIGLGIAAAVIFAQISYARHVDLGFRKDDVVVITHLEDMPVSNRESFANALRRYPGIDQVALAGVDSVPIVGGWIGSDTQVRLSGAPSDETLRPIEIDPQFTSTYDIRLLSGRVLSDEHGEDKMSGNRFNVLINASAAREFGLTPDQAIGKTATLWGSVVTIVGVIDDIKMGGPQHEALSAIYVYSPINLTTVSIRLQPGQISETLTFIDKTWSAFAPGFAIQRYFLSDEFNKQFDADERQGTAFTLFVGIAIFIACLGLFGLAAFTAERRTKEIGLRKTFGAKTYHIILLLLWQFSIPVLIANAVAWPLAYYYLHGWLEGYANRISLNPLFFIAPGAAALAIAWATVYVHAYRMASANPINALRHE